MWERVQAWPGPGVTEGFSKAPELRLGGRGPLKAHQAWQTAQTQVGTEPGFPGPPGLLGAACLKASLGRCLGSLVGHPRPPSSLGMALVLGHSDLRGDQEEDISFQVHHGLLPGLLG